MGVGFEHNLQWQANTCSMVLHRLKNPGTLGLTTWPAGCPVINDFKWMGGWLIDWLFLIGTDLWPWLKIENEHVPQTSSSWTSWPSPSPNIPISDWSGFLVKMLQSENTQQGVFFWGSGYFQGIMLFNVFSLIFFCHSGPIILTIRRNPIQTQQSLPPNLHSKNMFQI